MPGRPFTDAPVLDLLATQVLSDNRSLLIAPAFLDVRIIVVWLCHMVSLTPRAPTGREAVGNVGNMKDLRLADRIVTPPEYGSRLVRGV